jgi:hypothetical protein
VGWDVACLRLWVSAKGFQKERGKRGEYSKRKSKVKAYKPLAIKLP